MDTITLLSPAKVNLTFEILGKRADLSTQVTVPPNSFKVRSAFSRRCATKANFFVSMTNSCSNF